MPGSTAWIMRRTPMTLVLNSACAWLMLVSSTAPTRLTPALLISTSIRPARLRTSSTQALTEASSRTSSGTNSTPANGRVVAGARTPPKTLWSRAASSSAVTLPMPDDAPVIRTTRFGPFVMGTPGRAGGRATRLQLLSSSYPRSFASKAQLRSDPLRQAADCVVCLGGAASHHLEAVQHLGDHIEPGFDTGLRDSLGEHSAVIDKGLVASGLQVDRRESGRVRVERACMWIAQVTVANEIRR